MAERLPIIYVRGFAGGQSGIDTQTDDPFYGFNVGSTHVRVGARGTPTFYQFESPLLRLMLDHDYDLKVKGGQLAWLAAQSDGAVDPATIWIHRFYDVSASTFGEKPEKYSLERAAESLLELIELVQRKTGAPRVYLVAHSMGGLICRCLIQKVIPEQRGGDVAGRGPRKATDYVDRLFTYATPHGGIEFDVGFGLLEKVRDLFGINGADIFGPARMWSYLNPGDAGPVPPDWDPGHQNRAMLCHPPRDDPAAVTAVRAPFLFEHGDSTRPEYWLTSVRPRNIDSFTSPEDGGWQLTGGGRHGEAE